MYDFLLKVIIKTPEISLTLISVSFIANFFLVINLIKINFSKTVDTKSIGIANRTQSAGRDINT
jgi:hypothetical protein